MKKKSRSFLSVVLAVCMLASMVLTTTVFATETETTDAAVVYGNYNTEGEWAVDAEEDGTEVHKIEGTDVTVSKTAVPVEGKEDTYDVTLRVETTTTELEQAADAAVVLVIDVSGSMNGCEECTDPDWILGDIIEGFLGDLHKSSCSHRSESWRVREQDTRLYAAVKEAKDFLTAYAASSNDAKRNVAIVAFANEASAVLDWTDVAGMSAGEVESIFPGMSANGGTNLDAGLYVAKNLLNDEAVSAISEKSVILLTDGAPTYRMANNNPTGTPLGGGSNGSDANNAAAANQAVAIKDAGNTLYTVFFGPSTEKTYADGPSCGDFLAGLASAGSAYTADNASELDTVFDNITESITSGLTGNGWTVTDPMNEGVALTVEIPGFEGENGTYTWTLDTPTSQETTEDGVTTYVYELKYTVKVDFTEIKDYVDGEYHPLNGPTLLNGQYAFPVPAVKGELPKTNVSVTKEWIDADNQDGLRPAFVEVQLLKDGNAVDTVKLEADENDVWAYTWDGLVAKSSGVEHKYEVKEVAVPTGYTSAVSGSAADGFVITNIHTPETTEVSVVKVWDDADNQDGNRPESVVINLIANEEVIDNVELTEECQWTANFASLPLKENGQIIKYEVEEVLPEGYSVFYSNEGNSWTVTNTYVPETTDEIAGSKTWEDADNQDGIRPESITINLLANGEKIATQVVTEAEEWSWNFGEFDKYEAGEEIVYTIEEVAVEGYTSKVEGFDVTNTHEVEKTDVTVTKVWNDEDDKDEIRPESITVILYADGEATDTTLVLTAEDEWTGIFEDLDVYADGEKILYDVQEVAIEGYTLSKEANAERTEFTLTNTHEVKEEESSKPEEESSKPEEESSEPEESSKPAETDKDDVKTGDNNNIALYTVVAVVCLVAVVAIVVIKKKAFDK